MPSRTAIDVNCERLWVVAEWARARGTLSRDDVAFVRDTLPAAPVGTFLRSALLTAGQKALGRRFANHSFFENVERDLALGVMRSHFHHEYPKGTHCCVQCTLAVYPVLEAGRALVAWRRPVTNSGSILATGRRGSRAGPKHSAYEP